MLDVQQQHDDAPPLVINLGATVLTTLQHNTGSGSPRLDTYCSKWMQLRLLRMAVHTTMQHVPTVMHARTNDRAVGATWIRLPAVTKAHPFQRCGTARQVTTHLAEVSKLNECSLVWWCTLGERWLPLHIEADHTWWTSCQHLPAETGTTRQPAQAGTLCSLLCR